MADALEKIFSTKVTLTPGSGGVFDVNIDGKNVFSKQKEGRFPEPDEIVKKIG